MVTNSFNCILRHLMTSHWQVHPAFPRQTLNDIDQGALHSAALRKSESARARAIEVVSQLQACRSWTRHGDTAPTET